MNASVSAATPEQLAPGICPECRRANLDSAHFCTHCHHTLIYSCPKCWHEQRHGGICDACHLDLDKYWRVYGATKQAALINEEETNLEKSTKPIEGVLLTIASIPLQFVPFLSFLGYGLLLNWLRRRFSDVQ
jgi:hypothetical protein